MVRLVLCIFLGFTLPLAASAHPLTTQPAAIQISRPGLEGTIEVVDILDDLPPDFVAVSAGVLGGEHIVVIRAVFTIGDVSAIGILVWDGTTPMPPYSPSVTATGYVSTTDRIPGPDEFFPVFSEWFFDAGVGGPLLPGETVDLWVSYLDLEPGSILTFTVQVDGEQPMGDEGSVYVVPEPSMSRGICAGVVSLSVLSRGSRRRERVATACEA